MKGLWIYSKTFFYGLKLLVTDVTQIFLYVFESYCSSPYNFSFSSKKKVKTELLELVKIVHFFFVQLQRSKEPSFTPSLNILVYSLVPARKLRCQGDFQQAEKQSKILATASMTKSPRYCLPIFSIHKLFCVTSGSNTNPCLECVLYASNRLVLIF